jgi:hypothetical protein
MSAMIVSASEKRPPAPSPCTARNAASSHIDWANPHSADPTTNTVMAVMNHGRRP